MTSQASLLEIIDSSPLSQTTKDFFAKKVSKEGATEENIMALRELLRAVKFQVAKDMGAEVDMNSSDMEAAKAKLQADLTAASDQYTKTMKHLETATNRLTSDISEDLKSLEKIVVDSAQAEA